MTSQRSRVRAAALLGLLTLAASVALPSAAHAAQLPEYGRAVVRSVDGPGQLTIRAGKRSLPIRLFAVDLPRQGECGAAEATAALRGFVTRARGGMAYQLVPIGVRRYARDPDGRLLASVTYRGARRDLGADLIAAEWGRPGEPVVANGRGLDPALPLWTLRPGIDGRGDVVRPRRGVWARCGGRLHLPLGEAVPDSAPAAWVIDRNGITTTVGPAALSPTLSPQHALTVTQLASLAPAEMTHWEDACRAWLPALQIRVRIPRTADGRCANGYVTAISTSGPDPAPIAGSGAVGGPLDALRPAFPRLARDASTGDWSFSGANRPQWAWQTEPFVDDKRRVTGLATYASPLLPGGW